MTCFLRSEYMKKNILGLNLVLMIVAVGCAESSYTPNPSLPAYNTGINQPVNYPNTYPNTNLYPGNLNPIQTQMYNPYQARGMLSWNMRLAIPGYYNYQYMNRGCIPRTPYVAPCSQRTVVRTCHASIDCSSDQSSSVITQTSTENGDTTKILPISWKDEDAMALYQRLAREEEVIQKGTFKKDVKARTGENIKCVVEGNEGKARNYVCDLEIRMKDGVLLQQLPVGKEAQPVIVESSMYKGELLKIGVPGQAPEVGFLTVAGPAAHYLYQNLPGEVTEGKVEELGEVDAKIKTTGQVKCYKTLNATRNITECLIKIESNTGKALNF